MVVNPVGTEAFHKAIRTEVECGTGDIEIIGIHHTVGETDQLPFCNHYCGALNDFGGKG
ncbi:hypothetical protein D3C85_1858820 [compost metagenome]